MPDIATVWNADLGIGDWQLSAPNWPLWLDGDGNNLRDQNGVPIGSDFVTGQGLVSGQDLYTSVLISLFTDAAAGRDDIIPDGAGDPRGWWGDPNMGSKLWLRTRLKAVPATLALVKNDVEQALQWLIDDDVVASIDVLTEFTRQNMLGARITFLRRDGTRVALSFSRLWETF